MTTQRTCGACGGDGYGKYSADCLAVEHVERCAICPFCPVCAGRGTVDALASRADAMADAGTLREVASYVAGGWGRPWQKRIAKYVGNACGNTRKDVDIWNWSGCLRWDDPAYTMGVYCARAAFRAVPGLRGE
jgi:hypothetical protein